MNKNIKGKYAGEKKTKLITGGGVEEANKGNEIEEGRTQTGDKRREKIRVEIMVMMYIGWKRLDNKKKS